MNVGQILEAHLGWAARSLGQQIDELLRDHRDEIDGLRRRLKEYLNTKEASELLDGAKEADVFKLAKKYRGGVHLASRFSMGPPKKRPLICSEKQDYRYRPSNPL